MERNGVKEKVYSGGDENDDYYEEEDEEELDKGKGEDEEGESSQSGSYLSWNESFFSLVSERFLCLPRKFTLVASTEAELVANLSANATKTPSSEPRAAARAKRRRDLLLSRL